MKHLDDRWKALEDPGSCASAYATTPVVTTFQKRQFVVARGSVPVELILYIACLSLRNAGNHRQAKMK